MAKSIIKILEGAISIIIFISFLIFYIHLYYAYIYNKIENNQLNYDNIEIDNVLDKISQNYYILSINSMIPVSMYYQCQANSSIYNNLINENAYEDFCTAFPIFYPLNISFLTNYTGILNNTYDTYLDPNYGLYFYLNISNLSIENNSQYIILNISNPSNNVFNQTIFITNPDLFYWLQNNDNIELYDINNNQTINFCYQNADFVCNISNDQSFGIWANIYIPNNNYTLLNISITNSSYSLDGSNIFPFYDHFYYFNENQLSKNWIINTQIEVYYNNPGDIIYPNNSDSFTISSKKYINPGNYLVIFNASSSSEGKITIGNCNINIPNNNNNIYFYYCNLTENSNITIYNNGKLYIDYIILINYNNKYTINNLYEPNITESYNFIIGPDINYNSNNNLILNQNYIANNYILYNNNSNSLGYITEIINNYPEYYNPLFYYLYTNSNFPNTYNINDSEALLSIYNNYNLSINNVIFPNTYWFIINTKKYYNSNNMIYWNTNENNFGFQYGHANFYNEIFSYINSLLNNYLYLPYENGIILYSKSQNSTSLLFTNYNPYIRYYLYIQYNLFLINYYYLMNLKLLNNYSYENYYLYFYDNPYLDINTGEYLSFSTQIPIIDINYIKPIKAINLNNLIQESSNYNNIYFYIENDNITIYNGYIYSGNIVNNYLYSNIYNEYIFYNNTLYNDKIIIYIK